MNGRIFIVALGAALIACNKDPSAEVQREIAQREQLARELVTDAGAGRTWRISSRSDVHFEEGFGAMMFDPPFDFSGNPFRWMGQNSRVRLKTHPAAHAMRLALWGWIDLKGVKTRPVIAAYMDGQYFVSVQPDPKGVWNIEFVVPKEFLDRSWLDLKITISAVAYHWHDPPELNVALLNSLDWTEIP